MSNLDAIWIGFEDEIEKIGIRLLSRIPAVKKRIGIGGTGPIARARTYLNEKAGPLAAVGGSVAGIAAASKVMGGGQE